MKKQLNHLKKRMIQAVKAHTLTHTQLLEYIDNTSDASRIDPFTARNLFSEAGGLLCQKGEEITLPLIERSWMTVSRTANVCDRIEGKRVGYFHTHPTGPPKPSLTNLEQARKKRVERGMYWDDGGGSTKSDLF